MKLHRPLDDLLRGKGMVHVLRVVSRHPGSSFTAPELAKSGGLAISHVQGALAQLEGLGIVSRRIAGRSHLWSVMAGSALIPSLRALFETESRLEEGLLNDIREGLRGAPVQRATLFGSVARGEEGGRSDVDVLIEVPRASDGRKLWDHLLPLTSRIRERYGLNLAPIVGSRAELSHSLSPSFLESVRREGRILLEAR